MIGMLGHPEVWDRVGQAAIAVFVVGAPEGLEVGRQQFDQRRTTTVARRITEAHPLLQCVVSHHRRIGRLLHPLGTAEYTVVHVREVVAQMVRMNRTNDAHTCRVALALGGFDASHARARTDESRYVAVQDDLAAVVLDAADERLRELARSAFGYGKTSHVR